jgi:hypothetical protein
VHSEGSAGHRGLCFTWAMGLGSQLRSLVSAAAFASSGARFRTFKGTTTYIHTWHSWSDRSAWLWVSNGMENCRFSVSSASCFVFEVLCSVDLSFYLLMFSVSLLSLSHNSHLFHSLHVVDVSKHVVVEGSRFFFFVDLGSGRWKLQSGLGS